MIIKSMRKFTKQIIWALIITFALWGAGTAITGGKKQKGPAFAGTIFSRKVSFKEYAASYNACRNQAIMFYGDKFSSVAKYLGLEQAAWDRLILLNQIKKQNITVSDEQVIETIKKYPFFQKDGKFNKALYDYLITAIFRTTPRVFETEIKDSLSIEKMRNSIVSKITVSEEEIKDAYKKEFDKTKVLYFMVKNEDFESEAELTEDQLKDHYNKNSAEFKVAEQVNLQYLEFSYADFKEKTAVTEEEIKKYYNNNLEEFELPGDEKQEEKKNNQEAEKNYTPLKKVKDTIKRKLASEQAKDLARQKADEISDRLFDNPQVLDSLGPKETGLSVKTAIISIFGWSARLCDNAFSLKIGEISNPMSTPKGVYIIRPKDKKESYIPGFEETKEKVNQSLTKVKSRDLCKTSSEDYRSKIGHSMQKEGIDFKQACETLSLEVKDSGFFTRTGYIPEIGKNFEFSKTAFDLREGELSMPVKMRNGYAVLWLIKNEPADEEKLKTELDTYRLKVLDQKKSLIYLSWLNEARKKAGLKSNLTPPPES
ncbi:MAG: peptidyl-prolyl cis-trans isomerase [Candidatus Omnitrophota bacterium]|nr:peptidyl-prolyl cis-trans isomerase [Candidatus Omnitrophota bacterium]